METMEIKREFTVLGEPIGKPRMTKSDKWKKRPIVVYYRNWADAIRVACTGSADTKIDDKSIYGMRITFWFTTPSSWSAKKCKRAQGTFHRVRPDVDNCIKGVMDALFTLDSQISYIESFKMYAGAGEEPRTTVELISSESLK
jgi:Holliday junction resolvase RusA-like endonuclease